MRDGAADGSGAAGVTGMLQLSEIKVGDVIWNVETGHTGWVSALVGPKMTLLDPSGEETAFYFVADQWDKLHDQAKADFIKLLQK